MTTDRVAQWLRTLGSGRTAPVSVTSDDDRCAVLDWAASGGMALTGAPDGPPDAGPAAAFGLAAEVTATLAEITGQTGTRVDENTGLLLTGRAALAGYTRAGQRTAGGAGRLIRTSDGWCAVTLSRPDDIDAVPAILGAPLTGDPWTALALAARRGTAAALADRAQLLGVPAAALPRPQRPVLPWRVRRIAAPIARRTLAGRLVVDLSSMWAGPLCARLLGRAGATVVKVESPQRPDGARADARFFDWLHAGHEMRGIDFRSTGGRRDLADLLDAADIVIEASRPRALAQYGMDPDSLPHRAGRVWLGITGYGRDDPMRVAFGDDAAVAGGLVGHAGGEPVFCADAIADPLSGLTGALAVAAAVRAGGGVLIDLPMRAVAAAYASAPALDHGPHRVLPTATGWVVECPRRGRSGPVLPPVPPDVGERRP